MRLIFWISWSVNAAAAAIVVYFFLAGAADSSVSSDNIVLWLGILAYWLVILAGSLALRRRGQSVLATVILIPGAAGAMLYALFIILVITSGTRWN